MLGSAAAMLASLSACLFGLLNGMRHALEPDHLAAVSTLVAEQRTARDTVRFAAAWGLGHALVLVVVGGLMLLLRAELPAALTDAFELLVAVMLIGLGARAMRHAAVAGKLGPEHPHRHGGMEHTHAGAEEHVHVRGWTLARWPLFVGVIHGLAGTGALTALAVATVPSVGVGLGFIVLYAAGALLGMALLAGVAGVPLARFAARPGVLPALLGGTGALSLVLGFAWAWPIVARLV